MSLKVFIKFCFLASRPRLDLTYGIKRSFANRQSLGGVSIANETV